MADRSRPRVCPWAGAAPLLGLVAALALLAGCAALDPLQRKQSFEDSHKRFTQYMRWGKIADASAYVEPELRSEFLSLAPDIADMRFTDYEILSADVADGWQSAVVDVRISGYRSSWPVERTHVLTETWRRDGLDWLVSLDMQALRDAIAPSGSSGTP